MNGAKKHVNPIQVQKFLKGTNYPVGKQDLVNKAKSLGASEEVMDTLNQLPDQEYQKPVDVSRAIGKLP